MTRTAFAVVLIASSLAAQGPLAYPQASTATDSGTLVPLGYSKLLPIISESRGQQLLPARYLPSTGAVITAIDLAGLGDALSIPITYKSLKITLSTTSSTVSTGQLSTTFADNLSNPQVVVDRSDYEVVFQDRQWTRIPFSTPFRFDASGDLVIDFQKVLEDRTQTLLLAGHTTTDGRPDLPAMIYSHGSLGSGAATAKTAFGSAAVQLKVRLLTSGPILTIGSDPGGLQVLKKVFALGGSMTVTDHDTAGNAFVNLVSLGFGLNPWPLFGGKVYLGSPVGSFNSGAIGPGGSTPFTVPIPNLPGLVGAHLVFQGVSVGLGQAPRLTNAVDCFIDR